VKEDACCHKEDNNKLQKQNRTKKEYLMTYDKKEYNKVPSLDQLATFVKNYDGQKDSERKIIEQIPVCNIFSAKEKE